MFKNIDVLRIAVDWDQKSTLVLLDAAAELSSADCVRETPAYDTKSKRVSEINLGDVKKQRNARRRSQEPAAAPTQHASGPAVDGVRTLKHDATPEAPEEPPRVPIPPSTQAPKRRRTSTTTDVTFEEFSTGGEVRFFTSGETLNVSVNGWATEVGEVLTHMGPVLLLENGSKLTFGAHKKASILQKLGVLVERTTTRLVDGTAEAQGDSTPEEMLAKQKEYIKKHKVHLLLGDALDSCLRDLPSDPYYFIAATLMRYSANKSASQRPAWGDNNNNNTMAKVTSRTTSLECEVQRLQNQLDNAGSERALEKEVSALREQVARLVC